MAPYETIDYSLDLSRMIGGIRRMFSVLMAMWDAIFFFWRKAADFQNVTSMLLKPRETGQNGITGLSS